MRKKKIERVLSNSIGVLLSLLVIMPFYMIVINSFKPLKEANELNLSFRGITVEQIIQNYGEVFKEANIGLGYINSIIVTIISVTCIIIVATMTAYTLTRRTEKFFGYCKIFVIMGMTMPVCMVPTYFLVTKIGLGRSLLGAVLVYIATNFSLSTFIYSSFFKSISREIDEAAIIDGCGPIRLFFEIIFPLIKPATATIIISTFMTIWNDFSISIFLLNSPKRFTAVLTTYSFYGQKSSEWNLLFADVVLVSIPIILLYLFLQRFIISGMTSGAVKG